MPAITISRLARRGYNGTYDIDVAVNDGLIAAKRPIYNLRSGIEDLAEAQAEAQAAIGQEVDVYALLRAGPLYYGDKLVAWYPAQPAQVKLL